MNEPHSNNFNEFYQQHYRKCFLFAKSYVHDEWVSEDITSEALIKLWELQREGDIDNPSALLFTILKNKSLDYLRHEASKHEALSVMNMKGQRELAIRISTLEACDPDALFSKEIQEIIHKTINELPEQTRKVFMMSRFENISRQEIANILGISSKGVEYHISKTLKRLQMNLQDYLPVFYFLFCYDK